MLGLRWFFFIALSILLMVLDHKQLYVGVLRNNLSIAVTPIQYAVDLPAKFFVMVRNAFTTHHTLLVENNRLRENELKLNAELQKIYLLQQENNQLRTLLKSPLRNSSSRTMVAQLLSVDTDSLVQELILDKGSSDEIFLGQPVLDSFGIVGQIIQIGLLNSRVLLISDVRSAIPVQNNRTGTRGIIAGTGNIDKLMLLNTPTTADVKVGDRLISSGLGGHFPAGHPVGIITSIQHKPGEQFASIIVKPSANLNKSEQILLMWPQNIARK